MVPADLTLVDEEAANIEACRRMGSVVNLRFVETRLYPHGQMLTDISYNIHKVQ